MLRECTTCCCIAVVGSLVFSPARELTRSMTDQLQSLLSRLQQDGVDAGKQQADEIVRIARAEAARVLEAARVEAQQITERAAVEAQRLDQRAKASLQHAARDILLSIGQRIERLVQKLVGDRVAAVLDGPTVVALMQRLMDAFVERGRVSGALDLVVGEAQHKALTEAVLQNLREHLMHGITLHMQPGLGRGFQIKMGQGGVTHDFTDKAIAEAVAELVTPEIAAIVLEAALDTGARRS